MFNNMNGGWGIMLLYIEVKSLEGDMTLPWEQGSVPGPVGDCTSKK